MLLTILYTLSCHFARKNKDKIRILKYGVDKKCNNCYNDDVTICNIFVTNKKSKDFWR